MNYKINEKTNNLYKDTVGRYKKKMKKKNQLIDDLVILAEYIQSTSSNKN